MLPSNLWDKLPTSETIFRPLPVPFKDILLSLKDVFSPVSLIVPWAVI